jgi:RPA family protein
MAFVYLKLVSALSVPMTKFIRFLAAGELMADTDSSKRQVAYKLRIADLLNNRYVKEEGWLPNYIAVGDKKVSRSNLLGVIVSKSEQGNVQGFVLDDSSGRISLRFFDSPMALDVGDIVNVVGRPREFGAERYIVPEIVRKVSDSRWIEVRKLELAKEKQSVVKAEVPEELLVETEELDEESNPMMKIMSIIRALDSGDGVNFEDIAVKSGDIDIDVFLKRLLEHGDVFEIRPGRYKVLE